MGGTVHNARYVPCTTMGKERRGKVENGKEFTDYIGIEYVR